MVSLVHANNSTVHRHGCSGYKQRASLCSFIQAALQAGFQGSSTASFLLLLVPTGRASRLQRSALPLIKLSLPQPLSAINTPSGFGPAHRMQETDCYRNVQCLSKLLGIPSFTYLGESLLTPIVPWGKSSIAPIFLIPEHSGHLMRKSFLSPAEDPGT